MRIAGAVHASVCEREREREREKIVVQRVGNRSIRRFTPPPPVVRAPGLGEASAAGERTGPHPKELHDLKRCGLQKVWFFWWLVP